MKTLVLFSGGVESTSLMKYLLTETDDEIIAIHIYSENYLNRAKLEWDAFVKLTPKLQTIRKFQVKHVSVFFPWITCDAEVQSTIVPALMKGSNADRFFRGLCKEDLTVNDRNPNSERITAAVKYWLNTDKDICPMLPMFYWPKIQHMKYIEKYLSCTFSCLEPINNEPCGKCRTCLLRGEYENTDE